MNWNDVIRELRERGWTQKLLASRLGIAQSAISELSTGKTADPQFATGHALRTLLESGELPADVAEQS